METRASKFRLVVVALKVPPINAAQEELMTLLKKADLTVTEMAAKFAIRHSAVQEMSGRLGYTKCCVSSVHLY